MWDIRGHLRFYYRYRWVNQQARRVYMGTGAEAEQAAAEDELRWAQQAAAAQAWQTALAELEGDLQPHEDLAQASHRLLQATLLAAGFHQHDRNWRLRRDRKPSIPDPHRES